MSSLKIKPCCKVCCDAGKDESEYSSHWTKNEKGKVICPTLLALLCRHCNIKGHTVSYCPILNKNKKREAFFEKNEKVNKKNDKQNDKQNDMITDFLSILSTISPQFLSKYGTLVAGTDLYLPS